MINNDGKNIIRIYFGDRLIKKIYSGVMTLKLIWLSVQSCFGSGYWINNLKWDNNDGYKN